MSPLASTRNVGPRQRLRSEPFIEGVSDLKRTYGRELQQWEKALASTQALGAVPAAGIANIWFMGDSVSEATYGTSSDYQRWMWQLRDAIQRMYRLGGVGFIPARRVVAPLYYATNPDGKNAWTLTNLGDSNYYGFGLGDRSAYLKQAAPASLASITIDCDSFWLVFSTSATTAASVQIVIDANTAFAQTLTYNSTASFLMSGRIWESPVLPLGTHTVDVSVVTASGSVFLDGIMPFYTDRINGVHIWDGSHTGAVAQAIDVTTTDSRGAGATNFWADVALQPTNQTTFATGVGNGTTTFVSSDAAFVANDVDELIWTQTRDASFVAVPIGARIVSITNGTTVVLNKTVPSGSSLPFSINRATYADGVSINASNVYTSASAAFVRWDEGKYIKGTNIPAGTYIKRVTSATSIILSNNCTAGAGSLTFRINNRSKYAIAPDLMVLQYGLNDMKYAIPSATFKSNLKNAVQGVVDRGGMAWTPSVVMLGLWAPGLLYHFSDTGATVANGTAICKGVTGDYGPDLVGLTVTGTGIPGATTVLSYQNPYQVTLSANSTQAVTGVVFQNRITTEAMWLRYRQAMWELCDEMGWVFFDLYSALGFVGTTDPLNITIDLIHGGDRGNQLIANKLMQILTGMYKQASIPQGAMDAIGDLIVGGGPDVAGKLPAGIDGQIPVWRAGAKAGGLTIGMAVEDAGSSSTFGQLIPTPGGAGAVTVLGMLPTLTPTATATTVEDSEACWLNSATSITPVNYSGMVSAAFTLTRGGRLPEFYAYIHTDPTAITVCQYAIGFCSATLDANPPAATTHGAYFWYNTTSHGTAFWRTCTSGGTITTQVTGQPIVFNTTYRLKIVFRGVRGVSISAVDFYINDNLVSTHTTNLPAISTALGHAERVAVLSGATAKVLRTARVSVSGP